VSKKTPFFFLQIFGTTENTGYNFDWHMPNKFPSGLVWATVSPPLTKLLQNKFGSIKVLVVYL